MPNIEDEIKLSLVFVGPERFRLRLGNSESMNPSKIAVSGLKSLIHLPQMGISNAHCGKPRSAYATTDNMQ